MRLKIVALLAGFLSLDASAYLLGSLGKIGTSTHAWYVVVFTVGIELLLLGMFLIGLTVYYLPAVKHR